MIILSLCTIAECPYLASGIGELSASFTLLQLKSKTFFWKKKNNIVIVKKSKYYYYDSPLVVLTGKLVEIVFVSLIYWAE